MGQLARILAVGIHEEEFQAAGAMGAEDNFLAVGRIASLGIIARGMGQAFQLGAVGIGFEDIHGRVEVPLVAAAFAGGLVLLALTVFLGVVGFCIRIEVTAGEDNLLAVRPKVTARRAADAGTD